MPVLGQTRTLPQALDSTWERLAKKAEELDGTGKTERPKD
jgi:hypothetical protein